MSHLYSVVMFVKDAPLFDLGTGTGLLSLMANPNLLHNKQPQLPNAPLQVGAVVCHNL